MSTTRPTSQRTPGAPTVHTVHADEPTQLRPPATDAGRDPLAPPQASSRTRAGSRTSRRTRGRVLVMLAVSVVVLLGGALAVNAAAATGHAATAAQPAPTPPPVLPPTATPPPAAPTTGVPLPVPTDLSSCHTALPLPPSQAGCASPVTTPLPPPSSAGPCTGEGCIPQPTTVAPAPLGSGTGQSGGDGGNGDADCGFTDIGGCITNAINDFFRGIVTAALNPLLDLLSKTLLTTPSPDSLPRVGELWNNSWQILLVSYGLLVLIGGILVMAYETVQTRHSVKEVAPRLAVGFLAGALSLWLATKAIQIANGLAQAVMGGGVDASMAGETLRNLILGSLNGGIFIIFIGIFLAGMLIVLLVTYVVRVALTIILIVGAPLALMAHALPPTEGIARWWWKGFGGCLAIQIGQSLALITAMRVFLAPGGFTLFGPTMDGLVNLLVTIAIMYVLFKIPFWFLASLRGGGRSVIGTAVRSVLAYKTFGQLGGRGGGARTPLQFGGGHGRGATGNGGRGGGGGGRGPNSYVGMRTTPGGQYLLPLAGVRRTRSAPRPKPAPAPKPSTARGRQLALPLGDDWPEWKQHGPDGQYRLPLDVDRVKPAPPTSGQSGPGGRPRRRSGTQLHLPFDAYQGNRPTRSGQYPLPLHGVHRVTPPTPTPPRPAPPTPVPATRPTPRAGQQLRLPVDLPKPAPRTRPARPKPGGNP